ncbi:MAG: ABC transporter ATP-binding protein [Xanthobacteraceae bacterium]
MILLLPLLGRIGVTATSNQGLAARMLEKALALVGATNGVEILVCIIAIAMMQAGLFISLNWWTAKLARGYQRERQSELFRAFLHAKWSFLTGRKAGELINAIVTESDRLSRAFTNGLTIISASVVTVIYFALSLLIAWQVALTLAGFALAGGLALVGLYKKSYAVGRTLPSLDAELQSLLGESFAAIKILKATTSEDRAFARADPLLRRLEKASTFAEFFPNMVRALLEFFGLVGLGVVLVLGAQVLAVPAANVVVVLALFARLFPRLTSLQAQIHSLNSYVHVIVVIDELQATAEFEAERQNVVREPLKINQPTVLTVRDLQVRLDGHFTLDQINLRLPIPGLLAVVGTSGAGKSTLVHALLGFIEPNAGSIRLGGHEISSTPLKTWRRAIGYVPQETMLFHASIRDNLTLVNPGASEAEIVAAARSANALDFISLQPKDFDTIIGDQGVKLSGGQRQRLGIARALLANPALLIMDEAMSALDSESETEMLRTIEELRRRMGILIVSHRLAAVRNADCICVMEAGRVVESGTWQELMRRRTRLYSLAENQSLSDDRPLVAS